MFTLNVIMREDCPPEASQRAWDGICRDANAAMGEYWHGKLLAPHFEPSAKSKYQHQPRSRNYIIRKLKLAAIGKAEDGGVVDNVLTGLLRSSLEAAGMVRPFPSRVTITMVGPRYCTMRPYKSGQPDKGREILTVTEEEEVLMAAVAEKVIAERMNALREPKTTTNGE